VNAGGEKLMVFRIDGTVKAVSRICPHLNFDMYAAYSDDSKLYCPGHGVAFSIQDGSSRCKAFSLEVFEAFERDGSVFLKQNAAQQA
jgi:nitrite reductase/ring-hydroxylating ferredoxin subunit